VLLIFLVDQLSALPAPYVRLVIRSSHRLDMSPVKLSTIGSFSGYRVTDVKNTAQNVASAADFRRFQ